jgi:hypothetical protein
LQKIQATLGAIQETQAQQGKRLDAIDATLNRFQTNLLDTRGGLKLLTAEVERMAGHLLEVAAMGRD